MKPLSRRDVLRGMLAGTAVSVGLPPLEAMFNVNGTAYAAGGGLPLRFGLFFWGNGNLPERCLPPAGLVFALVKTACFLMAFDATTRPPRSPAGVATPPRPPNSLLVVRHC